VDALELSAGSDFGLNGAQIWPSLVEPCALKCAENRISANDAHFRHPYRKHTIELSWTEEACPWFGLGVED